MPQVSFIICSAGQGLRMKPISQEIPKHLLVLKNKTLLEWSLDSIPFREGDQLIVITANKKKFNERTETILKAYGQKFKISVESLKIDSITRGQAETALLVENWVKYSRIAIFNSDTHFQCSGLDQAIHELSYFGVAPCFKTKGNEWSFFKTQDDQPFYSTTQVEEKKRISDWCSTGFYYFIDGTQFFSSVKNALNNTPDSKELYIAPFYNQFLSLGVKVLECENFKPMGTPLQLQEFWDVSIDEVVKSNANN